MTKPFATQIECLDAQLIGPYRYPSQMLADQVYDDHASIHDDATAQKLGFKGGTIEGPTHFSQIVPLCVSQWGADFLSNGCISVQYRSAAYQGDPVRAVLDIPSDSAAVANIRVEREDGVEILRGTASSGNHGSTAVTDRLSNIQPLQRPVILRDLAVGMKRPRCTVRMAFDSKMGMLYPFALSDKLKVITETSSWYSDNDTPWGRPIIPFEMISVLVNHIADSDPWTVHGPTVDLFTDQEIRLIDGPLFLDEAYEVEREILALSGSKRTESVWIKSSVFAPGGTTPLATMILNTASLIESYEHYDRDLAVLA